MTKQEVQDSFVKAYTDNIHRAGSAELLDWLKSTDFFDAPASTMYHGAYEGGLALHSLHVCNEAFRLRDVYANHINVSNETVALCSLLHDVCKIGCYNSDMRNVK